MAGARERAGAALSATHIGLLGGSFNPAHRGHRRISTFALKALALDELWWLVSPGNPLKEAHGMAPLPARYASAAKMAGNIRVRATAIEAQIGTVNTVDTIEALRRLYPGKRFIWIMGADNLGQFHRWRDWRRIARAVPIAVIARPGYDRHARASEAMGWFKGFVRPASQSRNWTEWRPPALVLLRFRPDPSSATRLRKADPDWHRDFPSGVPRDGVTRAPVI